jgi:Arc/MetJ-type ribon-helix-helix transcriptional regulator
MRATATFTVSLPPAMAKQVERAMRKEHRTRSELVREALRVYLSTRVMPMETPTADEIRAYRSGIAAYKRGDYVNRRRVPRWNGPSSSPGPQEIRVGPDTLVRASLLSELVEEREPGRKRKRASAPTCSPRVAVVCEGRGIIRLWPRP